MASKKQYWRSFEELTDNTLTEKLASNEFAEDIPVEEFLGNDKVMNESQTSRRDFLKILGFSTAAVTLAACEAPVIKSIPYVVKPNSITPGVPTYYASTVFDGLDYANVLVRTREGRPIRIDANKSAKYFGFTNARTQAAVLSLYDSDKIKNPLVKSADGFKDTTWTEVDKTVGAALANVGTKKIVILTTSLPSPTTKRVIEDFKIKYPTAEHVVYDALNYSNALDAAEEFYGKRALPFYDLEKAELVVSFNADFLADYNGGGMEGAYAKARKPSPNMLRHIQVESVLSLTGANADTRLPKKPTETARLLAEVYKGLVNGATSDAEAKNIVAELKAKGNKAVVLADGSKEAFALAYAINEYLNSNVVSKEKVILLKESNNKVFNQFLSDAKAGRVGVLLGYQVNPVYNHPRSKDIISAFGSIATKVIMSEKEDETAKLADIIAPVPHGLESWNDIQALTGVYSLQQPTIQRIFDSRQFQDSLLTWATGVTSLTEEVNPADPIQETPQAQFKQKATVYSDYLKKNWEENILPKLGYTFNQALYNGYNEANEVSHLEVVADVAAVGVYANQLASAKATDWELQLYTKVGLGDGSQANNPWLQEFPDPITKASWDNYITLNPEDAGKFDISIQDNNNVTNGRLQFNGDYVNITANGVIVENVPVFIQPGQAIGTVALALGYGRVNGGKVANGVGVNAYPLYKDGKIGVTDVKIERTRIGEKHEFACSQMQNTLMGRYEIARETDLGTYLDAKVDVKEWNQPAVMPTWRGNSPMKEVDLWNTYDRSTGPHFNLSIDLNACTGCGACVIACQAENNISVVGKDEVRRFRDMYWLRIDRYYSDITDNTLTQKVALEGKDGSGSDGLNEPQQYKLLIKAKAENPDVIFQPVMCQHCNHAPCETVCPVAATSHGRQGQNMMAYNRCVGTRYCANNCPYKVRRFNWFTYSNNDQFDYNMNNDLGRMVLNPDVVVRTRGVMEKCSLCIQQTQAVILKAKKENRAVSDNEFRDAAVCAAACGSGAMVFGDINRDKELRELRKDKRSYVLLEEVGTQPNVFYHVKVKNRKKA